MLTNRQRNRSLAVVTVFFGGYALYKLRAGYGHDAYEATFLGVMLCAVILMVARRRPGPSA